ncbi:MAG: ABC transporter ATP-binding protein [Reyranella sp.]|jgi:branched-chain amino acid transport system ATP-binding protein|nr:MAG: ABC transporter ATP-binding protein [Reyranella sp.]
MSAALLRVDKVSKRFGGFTALQDISVDIRPGERFGLIGPNGSGKTTLINCISGALTSDGGSIVFDGHDVTRLPAYKRTRRGIARSFQVPRPFRTMTVLENLLVAIDFGVESHGLSGDQATAEVMAILEKIGLADKARVSSGQLSQVELRKMELARAMAARPKLLISDEAMAGLAGAEIDEVLDVLLKLNGEGITVIMIEHIMQAVMRFSERVMCLDAGRIVCEGTPAQVMDDKRVQEAYLGA